MITIFMGTCTFASAVLETLQEHTEVKLVVTQPDRPQGRKQVLTPSPVKNYAVSQNLLVFQPENIRTKEAIEKIVEIQADCIIVASYGQIIPRNILEFPRLACINVHPSMLPKYRGASPIETALLDGIENTGITIIRMNEKLDHGPILAQESFPIDLQDNYDTLEPKLAKEGGQLLVKTLQKLSKGEIKPHEQNHVEATFTKKISKVDGRIDWNKNATSIYNQIRAYSRWPGSFTFWNKTKLTFISAEVLQKLDPMKHDALALYKMEKYIPGQTFTYDKELAVLCGEGILLVHELQKAGKNKVQSKNFLNGNKPLVNAILE